jgi:hypothetical protein
MVGRVQVGAIETGLQHMMRAICLDLGARYTQERANQKNIWRRMPTVSGFDQAVIS